MLRRGEEEVGVGGEGRRPCPLWVSNNISSSISSSIEVVEEEVEG